MDFFFVFYSILVRKSGDVYLSFQKRSSLYFEVGKFNNKVGKLVLVIAILVVDFGLDMSNNNLLIKDISLSY